MIIIIVKWDLEIERVKSLLLIAVTLLHLISSCGEVRCCSRDAPLKEMAVSVMLILWYIVFAYKVYFFLFVLKDLIQVQSGQLAHHLKKVIAHCTKHVYKCKVRNSDCSDWNRSVLGNYFFPYNLLHPLILRSYKHLNSPYKITPESNIKVTRIKETITNY